jgi:hypothetical protein
MDLTPNYQIFSDISIHDTDGIRSKNYAGWDSSGMICITILHKDIFNISLFLKHEWRSVEDRRSTLGRGRVFWIGQSRSRVRGWISSMCTNTHLDTLRNSIVYKQPSPKP